MKSFKKWLLEKFASQNKNPVETDAGTDRASGYDRVNPPVNSSPPNNLRSSAVIATRDNRNCTHADKSGLLRPSHHLRLLDTDVCDCQSSRVDNSAIAATGQFGDKCGCGGCISDGDRARNFEYGLKSINVASQLEYNLQNSTSSISVNDDFELLDLDEYEIINLEDFLYIDTSYSALDYFFHFGSGAEYGLTLDQVEPPKKSPKSVKKKGKPNAADTRKIELDVLDALNRSLMGPLYQSQPKEANSSLVESSNSIKAANSMMQSESVNVQKLFGLDSSGNITIDVGHIEEERGECMYYKKRYQKYFRKFECAEEVSENTKFRLTWKQLIRKILICLRCVSEGHPRNKTVFSGPGETIGMYALSLADYTESTFSRNILNFISCTKESKAAPQVIMRNMRQFMSGMKNYLVKHGEGEFAAEVQKARSQLKSDEFLNLDSILEEVMHRLVILPLREHLYGLFVDYYTQSGDIQLLVEKVKQASGRGSMVFGIKNTVTPPSASALRQISTLFVRLQEAELPLEKLDLLLTAVSTIFEATSCTNGQQLSADDFLPVLVLVVAHCGFIGAEIEAEYMWGLIQPSLLSGEAGYYLTALCSAVHVLKNFSLQDHDGLSGSVEWTSPTFPECSSVLRVIIPDEYNGSIQTRTLPIRPHTTTREVCRIIAHKARITNAQDYGLFKLIDGEETLLQDNECPQDVRMAACGKHCMIAYKRVDAKIAWPTVMPTTLTDSNQ
ncbi:protein sprint isoform X4 [Topomyia yanbarensis]|uniref:protein sprint isoform X4 n=1 Tax=Topomyia yanbarensis TaxID=2498891 RepID=UPI00273B6A07|nr:protein sprint isoform X4 [Topomyia yanbarensis]